MRTWDFWKFEEACRELEAMEHLELVNVYALGAGTLSENGRKDSIRVLSHKAGEHKWHRQVETKKEERSWIEDLRIVLGGGIKNQEEE